HVLPFAAEEHQPVQPALLALDRVGQLAALQPAPRRQHLAVVALDQPLQVLQRPRLVARHLVGVEQEHALVNVRRHTFLPHFCSASFESALYRFMPTSTPCLPPPPTACIAVRIASSITGFSPGLNRPST